LAAEPVELGFLQVYPQVEGVQWHPRGFVVRLRVRVARQCNNSPPMYGEESEVIEQRFKDWLQYDVLPIGLAEWKRSLGR